MLTLLDQSVTDQIILKRPAYDYAPAVINDRGLYRLYWCAGIAGDYVLYAESYNPAGPWHSSRGLEPGRFDIALRPTGSSANFDGRHTCDPNVIKVGNDYYMYYGGSAADSDLTAIGVARSSDGVHFSRLNGGKPIVTAARTNPEYAANRLTYGAGQPAILYRDSYFYLSFTDSTGSGANPVNGAGQFLLRSKDPTFQIGVQEWTRSGWSDRDPGRHTAEFSYLESFGIDWMLDALTGRIIVATDRLAGTITLFMLDADNFSVTASGELATHWREGPSLIARSDKTTMTRTSCEMLQIGVIVAEGPSQDPRTWDLALSIGNFKIPPCEGAGVINRAERDAVPLATAPQNQVSSQ